MGSEVKNRPKKAVTDTGLSSGAAVEWLLCWSDGGRSKEEGEGEREKGRQTGSVDSGREKVSQTGLQGSYAGAMAGGQKKRGRGERERKDDVGLRAVGRRKRSGRRRSRRRRS